MVRQAPALDPKTAFERKRPFSDPQSGPVFAFGCKPEPIRLLDPRENIIAIHQEEQEKNKENPEDKSPGHNVGKESRPGRRICSDHHGMLLIGSPNSARLFHARNPRQYM